MTKDHLAEIVINEEKLSDGTTVFVAHCVNLGIASQGADIKEALKNIKEAIYAYLEEQPEAYEMLVTSESLPTFSLIEVNKTAQVAGVIR